MDGYEKKLVVMLRIRQAVLQTDQVGHAQVFIVGKWSVAAVVFSHLRFDLCSLFFVL
jgi:hypothetical protein